MLSMFLATNAADISVSTTNHEPTNFSSVNGSEMSGVGFGKYFSSEGPASPRKGKKLLANDSSKIITKHRMLEMNQSQIVDYLHNLDSVHTTGKPMFEKSQISSNVNKLVEFFSAIESYFEIQYDVLSKVELELKNNKERKITLSQDQVEDQKKLLQNVNNNIAVGRLFFTNRFPPIFQEFVVSCRESSDASVSAQEQLNQAYNLCIKYFSKFCYCRIIAEDIAKHYPMVSTCMSHLKSASDRKKAIRKDLEKNANKTDPFYSLKINSEEINDGQLFTASIERLDTTDPKNYIQRMKDLRNLNLKNTSNIFEAQQETAKKEIKKVVQDYLIPTVGSCKNKIESLMSRKKAVLEEVKDKNYLDLADSFRNAVQVILETHSFVEYKKTNLIFLNNIIESAKVDFGSWLHAHEDFFYMKAYYKTLSSSLKEIENAQKKLTDFDIQKIMDSIQNAFGAENIPFVLSRGQLELTVEDIKKTIAPNDEFHVVSGLENGVNKLSLQKEIKRGVVVTTMTDVDSGIHIQSIKVEGPKINVHPVPASITAINSRRGSQSPRRESLGKRRESTIDFGRHKDTKLSNEAVYFDSPKHVSSPRARESTTSINGSTITKIVVGTAIIGGSGIILRGMSEQKEGSKIIGDKYEEYEEADDCAYGSGEEE